MSKKNTYIILILSTITFLIVLGLLIFLFKVIKNKNLHTNATLQTLEEKNNDKEKEKLLRQIILEAKDTSQSLKKHYLDKEEIDVFVTYLEDLGNKVNAEVVFKNVEVLESSNLTNFKIYIIGDFSQVVKSIELIENSPYQINIDQVFLNKSIGLNSSKNIKNTNSDTSNQQLLTGSTDIETKWQADISFSVLSL